MTDHTLTTLNTSTSTSPDRNALETLIRQNMGWLQAYASRRLGNGVRRISETQDLVQESMVDVIKYSRASTAPNTEQFRALLVRIVENNIRDHHEWLARDRRSTKHEEGGLSPSVVARRASAPSMTTPSQAADRIERSEWVQIGLRLLDPADRQLIELREVEKMSFADIGERLGLRANTARMRYARAIPRLALRVGEIARGQKTTAEPASRTCS